VAAAFARGASRRFASRPLSKLLTLSLRQIVLSRERRGHGLKKIDPPRKKFRDHGKEVATICACAIDRTVAPPLPNQRRRHGFD
jgi:hypothetical protein